MPKISTDNCFTLEIFGSKRDQRPSAKTVVSDYLGICSKKARLLIATIKI